MSARRSKIAIRVDGNLSIGMGHVYRMLSLAETVQSNFEIAFLTLTPGEVTQAVGHEFEVVAIDNPEIEFLAHNFPPDTWAIAVDGYQFDATYFKRLADLNYTSFYIDDLYNNFKASVIINHSPNANSSRYSGTSAHLALGIDYNLIRKNFKPSKNAEERQNIFVCYGMADPHGIGPKVVQSLLNHTDQNIHYLGSHGSAFKASSQLKIHDHLNGKQLSAVLDTCKAAFVASSNIGYECCLMQVPAFSGYFVENQFDLHEGFKKLGCILPLGDISEWTEEKWDRLVSSFDHDERLVMTSHKLKATFDYKQQKRLLELFVKYC